MSKIDKLKTLPINPGCYLFKNSSGKLIYVGKAKNLKKRVSSYWQKKDHDTKTQKLVKEIVNIDYFITDNEVEALLLEARLIRENKPKYNIDLKDSVRYAYLKITSEKFPRLLTVRSTNNKDKFFGPYADGSARARIALMAVKMFKIRTCKKLSKRACLQYHIGNCQAPCVGFISEEDYHKNIREVKLFLKGDTKKLVKNLTARMKRASDQKEYEQAKIFCDQLESLHILEERQKVDLLKKVNQDVVNYTTNGMNILLQIFHIKKGTILNKEEFRFTETRCLTPYRVSDTLVAFIKQYYASHEIPHEIILPRKLKEQDLIKKYLEKTATRKAQLTIPQKGIKKELLKMVKRNLVLSLEPENQPLVDLRDKLNLATLSRVIECFDVSNIGATNMVGAMVAFLDGAPDKSNYRKFKIKTKNTQDDFAAMGEIVKRRYARLKKDNTKRGLTPHRGLSPSRLPDLIVIDGGLGQLHSAQERLEKLGLKIPIIGLAKREELIYTLSGSRPIRLNKKSAGLKLLQRARDEAHRFAVGFHRQRRRKF